MRGPIDPTGLLLLAAIARAGSLSRAATALNTVQPNVTSRLRALEETIGAPLFERHSRGVTPTETGRMLLSFAHRIEAVCREAGQALDECETPRGALRIGSMETTAALRLPAVLAEFTRTFPDVELVLRTGPTADLVAAVLAGELDAALVAGPSSDTRLTREVVFREELVLVTRPGETVAKLAAQTARIIAFKEGCSYREKLEQLLAARGVGVTHRQELGTLEGILACIGAGLGIGLLPAGVVENARRAGLVATHALPPETGIVETLFIRRAGSFEPRSLRAFRDRLCRSAPTIRAAE